VVLELLALEAELHPFELCWIIYLSAFGRLRWRDSFLSVGPVVD